jgi:hypothetical protein
MRIILLSGYAGSGKDIVGSLFVERGYKRYAFADKVKSFTAKRHGFPLEMTLTQEGKNTIVKSVLGSTATVRDFLIIESARMKRERDDSAYWAAKVSRKISRHNEKFVVITDWRYKVEYEHLVKAFPTAVIQRLRILRPSVQPMQDASEHELDNAEVDEYVFNIDEVNEEIAKIYLRTHLDSLNVF